VAVDILGRFAYVTNASSKISAYRIGARGAPTPVAGSPFPTGDVSSSVAVDPLGRFAYVTNRGDNNVSAYCIAQNGALTPVAGSPFPTAGNPPASIAISP
jgi:6-phosphogluconolactonase